MIPFYKYHGAGNDFILIDNRKNIINPRDNEYINHICHRRFGIGADGVILLENDDHSDFYMRYFNADGYESVMCGNGGRCIVAFAHKLGIIKKSTSFNGWDGLHLATISGSGSTLTVNLKLRDLDDITIGDGYYFMDTGSPHYIKFVENLKDVDVVGEGRRIRHSALLAPDGANVNFCEITDDLLLVATFERGVEDETYACGLGSVATAIAAGIYMNSDKNSFDVKTKGGDLKVRFEKIAEGKYRNIWLEGPAAFVFEGEI